jgi:hypothetical protein
MVFTKSSLNGYTVAEVLLRLSHNGGKPKEDMTWRSPTNRMKDRKQFSKHLEKRKTAYRYTMAFASQGDSKLLLGPVLAVTHPGYNAHKNNVDKAARRVADVVHAKLRDHFNTLQINWGQRRPKSSGMLHLSTVYSCLGVLSSNNYLNRMATLLILDQVARTQQIESNSPSSEEE